MGAGTSSGSTSAVVTPEQTQQNQLTNQMLASYIPVLQSTLQGAQNTYNTVQPYVNNAALNTYNQAATSQGVNNAVTNAANNFANSQTAFSQGAEQAGNQITQNAASGLGALGGSGATTGLSGSAGVAGLQAATGQNLTNSGASALQKLFSPEYEQQQVQGALAPAEYAAQQANVGMNAGFAGAGQLGSARGALANQQTQALNNQMLGSVAAQTEAGIQAQQANAANSLLTAGQGALGQSGNLYSNLYGTGSSSINNAGNLGLGTTNAGVNAGNTAVSAGGLGLQSNQNAVANAAAQSSAAQSPLSAFNQFASTIFGVPSSTNTANFTGTQGQNTSGKGIGGQVKF
jgi:hypothetical protein